MSDGISDMYRDRLHVELVYTDSQVAVVGVLPSGEVLSVPSVRIVREIDAIVRSHCSRPTTESALCKALVDMLWYDSDEYLVKSRTGSGDWVAARNHQVDAWSAARAITSALVMAGALRRIADEASLLVDLKALDALTASRLLSLEGR